MYQVINFCCCNWAKDIVEIQNKKNIGLRPKLAERSSLIKFLV